MEWNMNKYVVILYIYEERIVLMSSATHRYIFFPIKRSAMNTCCYAAVSALYRQTGKNKMG